MRMHGISVAGRRRRKLIGLLVAGTLVAASCGDDDDDDGAADTGGATTAPAGDTTAPSDTGAATTAPSADTTAPSDTGAATTAPSGETTAPSDTEGKVTDFAGYVGGSGAADTSLPPVKIGYINQQGGSIVVTDTNDDGVDIGVKYINEEAGGIGGRPIEVVQCFIADTEEEGQQCGQQFANDDEIVAVVTGPTVTGTESFYAAIAGAKPVIGGVSVNPADTQQDERGGPVRRRAVHPGAVRDVRRGRLGRDVSGVGVSGRCRSGRRRRRTGIGVRDPRHPDQRRALPAQRTRPHGSVARR